MERRKVNHKTHSLKAREAMLHELIKNIGVPIKQLSLLDAAFTHSSYANEHKLPYTAHNERLEFLGDAILDLIIGEYVFLTYPEMPEGELTRIKAGVVCESTLAERSRTLGLGDYLLMGNGELSSGGNERASILADTFEALLGAIYLDGSYEQVKQFALSHLSGYVEMARTGQLGKDFKTLLQELVAFKWAVALLLVWNVMHPMN